MQGARIHLSPLSRSFDLDTAEKYLDFAIQFTPQYGDSFLELLRLLMIREVIFPQAQRIVKEYEGDASKDNYRPCPEDFFKADIETLELR